MEIKHIEVLIHPDHAAAHGFALTPRQAELRTLWDSRIIGELARQENSALFYFPAVGINTPKDLTDIQELEQVRRRLYESTLEERFFCIESFPTSRKLNTLLKSRNFSYDNHDTDVAAYGQYYNQCVFDWLYGVRIALDIPYWLTHRIPELSLKQPGEES